MKKSKFAHLNSEGVEVLSKEQMSKIAGGYGSSGGGFHCPSGISADWCNSYWQSSCGPGCVLSDSPGWQACMRTCSQCGGAGC